MEALSWSGMDGGVGAWTGNQEKRFSGLTVPERWSSVADYG